MIQIGIQSVSSASPERSPAVPGEPVRQQIGKDFDSDGPQATDAEDQILFVSPPPLPFPRVYPGL